LRPMVGDGSPFGVGRRSADQCEALRFGHTPSLCGPRRPGFRLPALARINRPAKLCHTAVTAKTDYLFEIQEQTKCLDTERLFA
jgi:hypothetical protein